MKQMQIEKIVKILWKFHQKESLTQEEQEVLDAWLSKSIHNQKVLDEVMDDELWNRDLKLLVSRDDKAIWNKITPQIREYDPVPKAVKLRTPWYNYAAAAAALVVTLLAGTYFLVYEGSSSHHQETAKTAEVTQKPKTDVPPGGNKATLTLSDGSTITLDRAANGILTQDGVSKINKIKDGELVYDAAQSNSPDQLPITFNILSTPKGGRYSVTLQDGSRVWLNAASTLRFPTAFDTEERTVELTGEAYFDIAPTTLSSNNKSNHSRVPFHVKVNGMDVEVLGTEFNVMAYTDEAEMKTTLLEGAVKVSAGSEAYLLKPGQQAEIFNPTIPANPVSKKIRIVKADTEAAVGWKNGNLHFKNADVESVMRMVSRWYNVNVVYRGNKPAGHYSGIVSGSTNLSEVLNMLELSGINAKFDGQKIIVLPS